MAMEPPAESCTLCDLRMPVVAETVPLLVMSPAIWRTARLIGGDKRRGWMPVRRSRPGAGDGVPG